MKTKKTKPVKKKVFSLTWMYDQPVKIRGFKFRVSDILGSDWCMEGKDVCRVILKPDEPMVLGN